jgi:hypothetical protein
MDTSMGGMCTWAGDLDGDGDDDLLVCATEAWGGRRPGLRAFRNDAGTLVPATGALGLRPLGDVDALAADLDGDDDMDMVQVTPTQIRISAWAGGSFHARYVASVSSAVAVAAGDVNGDDRPDLYLVRDGAGNKPDLLLVNGGQGTTWTSVVIPQATTGDGDDVYALDHDRNGLDDFLVLNGAGGAGPLQLLASYPKP